MGYVEDLRKIVGHRPLIFVGAATIIVDDAGRLLLQQRTFPRGVWGDSRRINGTGRIDRGCGTQRSI